VAASANLSPAMKWRIEIIRERWIRIRVASTAAPCCSGCGLKCHWAPLAQAVSALQLQVDRLDTAIEAGLLAVTEGSHGRLVCLRCVRDLLANKKL
jgi:hypothetical protein